MPNFDRRLESGASGISPTPLAGRTASVTNRVAGETALRAVAKHVRVDRDEITGAPAFVGAPHEFLTGPDGTGRTIAAARLSRLPASDPHRVVKAFVDEYSTVFGHGSDLLAAARVRRDYVTAHNGLRTVDWDQYLDDIRIFEASFQAHLTARGELVNVASHLVANPQQAAERGAPDRARRLASPAISAQAAVTIAATWVGAETPAESLILDTSAEGADARQVFHGPTLLDAEVRYVWLPIDAATLRLCWQVICTTRSNKFMYRLVIDAETGGVHLRQGLTEHLSAASYRVFTGDSPSPFSPGLAVPSTFQAPLVSRTLVTTPGLDLTASPNGWLDDGVMETRGNNVDAHTDLNADNLPDLPRPQASGPDRVFDPPLDLTQDPSTYRDAAIVNLFYWCNFMHDKLYALGFTEAAGNFQNLNFGKGGVGNDAVQADAQDGSGTNNANFSTPPDGLPGRMQMYVFTGPTPKRDGDLDAEVILHEYTHGLSSRLVGGGVGISALQTRGMGEGWSDFYATCLLSDPSDDVNGNYAAGAYASYQLNGLTQNYYFGIRRYPYTTDLTKNPLTLKDLDPAQASLHPGIPRSPIAFPTANEVHNMGEVWCVTLWEARAKLINKFGAAAGNQLMLQLATDGMKLSPANPNFLQARDAIIQADFVDTGGANRIELWSAFAKRGMGFSAFSPASSTTSGIVEAFDLPDDLEIKPTTVFAVTASLGGPFPTQTYTLSNAGNASLSWTAATTQPWLTLDVTAGVLAPGASTTVTASFTAAAATLAIGSYSDTVTFTDLTSGRSFTRAVGVSIQPPLIVAFPLDSDPGWSRSGEWAFGHPTGGGGVAHGFRDPNNGATGVNVFGINLNGDYVVTTAPAAFLTAGPYDLTGYANTRVQFQRWLNADFVPFVTESLDVSRNGTTWTRVWDNGSTTITDKTWTQVQHDISAVADNQPTVYIRWGHQVTSAGAFAYSGWNIDDVALLGQTGAAAPTITTQPVSQTAAPGDTVIFSVSATGLPTPTYQWKFNGAPILGATSSTLTLSNVQLSQVGTYTVTVTNTIGSVTSSPATLGGTAPLPTIVTPPANVVATAGQSATFRVEATDPEALAYQWRRNGFPLPGATGSSLTLENLSRTDTDYYDVVVSAGLSAITSSVARLSVAPTAYANVVGPDPAWNLQPEFSLSSNGLAVAALGDGSAYIAGLFSSVNGARSGPVARISPDGTILDPSFVPPEIDNTVRVLSAQSDGKVVIAGDFLRVGGVLRPHLARLNYDGSLDTSFASALSVNGSVFALAVQADGRILVGGSFFNYGGTPRNSLVRLNADGSLDASFRTLGVTGSVNSILVQGDGRILVGGAFASYADLNGVLTSRMRIARLNSDGTLDPGFNLVLGPNSTVTALGVQADGRVLAGGSFTAVGAAAAGDIARFNDDGSLDPVFTASGIGGFNTNVNAITVLANGRILVGGSFTTYAGAPANRLVRLNGDGTRDTTYLTLGVNGVVNGLALQNTGQLLVAGSFASYLNTSSVATPRSRFERLNFDGSLDSGYNLSFRAWGTVNGLAAVPGGKLLVTGTFNFIRGKSSPLGLSLINADGTVDPLFNPGGSGANGTVSAAAVEADGKIVITGFFSSYNGISVNGIARLNTNGALDRGFNPGAGLSGANTIAVLPGGRIFVGGSFVTVNGVARGRVAVFGADGTLDPNFAAGLGASSTVYASAVQSDGKIIIGGNFTTYNGTPALRIARLNPDGTLDPTFILGTGGNGDVTTIALHPNGQIVIGGNFTVFNASPRSGVARLNANGVLDLGFVPPSIGLVNSLVVQEDGRVVIRGSFASVGGAAATAYLARLNPNGSRDATFASGGLADSNVRPSVLVMRDDGQFAMQANGAAGLTVTQNASGPSISSQPTDQAVKVGETAVFTVTGSSVPLPLTYQWLFNGAVLPGATRSSLVLENVQISQAGGYQVIVANELGTVTSAPAKLTVAKAAALVLVDNLAQTFDGTPRAVTVTTVPSGLPVVVTYNGSATVPIHAGTYEVTATVDDLSYEGSAVGTLTVAKAVATVTVESQTVVYDGTPKAANTSTAPAGLYLVTSYNGILGLPIHAGTYAVNAVVVDPDYSGNGSGTLTIVPAPAAITLGSLSTTYDGTAKAATAVTSPSGLTVALAYDGSASPPINAGSYAVTASILDSNYVGTTSGMLTIAKANAAVTLAGLQTLYDGTPKSVTVTTNPSGLATQLTYNGSATLPTYPGSYDVVATIDDRNYAGSATGVFSIAITALVRHAPSIDGGLDGSLQLLLPESANLNSSAWVSGDFLLPGTPSIQRNGSPLFAGLREANGSAVPSNYQVVLNSGATLRYLVRRMDAIELPTVDAPPPPNGTRSVVITTAGMDPGPFATVRDLTLNGNVGQYAIPAGTYGALASTGSGGFILGVSDATTSSVYNLQSLTLSGSSQLVIVGPVVIHLANGLSLHTSVGAAAHPEWLILHLASGSLTLSGNATLSGFVVAPTGTVTLNSGATLRGGVISDRLSINANALLATPPAP